jgi:hypothetical protein
MDENGGAIFIARLPAATKKESGLSLWHNSGLKSARSATTSPYATTGHGHISKYTPRKRTWNADYV